MVRRKTSFRRIYNFSPTKMEQALARMGFKKAWNDTKYRHKDGHHVILRARPSSGIVLRVHLDKPSMYGGTHMMVPFNPAPFFSDLNKELRQTNIPQSKEAV